MKYRTQYDLADPEVLPADDQLDEAIDPNAPDDAYTIGEHGNTVRAPDANARKAVGDAPKPWVKPLAALLAVLFVALTGWNVSRLAAGPKPLPPPTEAQVRQTLYLGVMRIDAYRRANGVTPDTLGQAGLPENAGYSYRRVDPRQYVLGFQNGASKLEYNSSVPKESFFGSPQSVLSMGANE